MARVIEFYVPGNFRRSAKWIPPKQRGKVIQFPRAAKEVCLRSSANMGTVA